MLKLPVVKAALLIVVLSLALPACTVNKNPNNQREENRKSPKDFSTFKGLQLAKDDLKIRFEGKDLNLVLPVYYEVNRYYLSLNEIVDKLGGTVTLSEQAAEIDLNNVTTSIDLGSQIYVQNGVSQKLKKKAIVSDGVLYISMFDFHKIFDLRVDWDLKNKSLAFYRNREKVTQRPAFKAGRQALLRLEDVTVRDYFLKKPEDIQKLTVVADYLYSQNVPFHVAWIPRYIDPRSNIDIDPSKQYSMVNASFVYALDYISDRNGIIGLHGYTHQYGKSVSVDAVEFLGPGIPGTDQYVQDRINASIEAAKALDLPYGFFEAPHYAISPKQLSVAEKNFDVIYEQYPGIYGKLTYKQNGNRTTKYVPTPLDYLNGKGDVNVMIARIKNLGPNTIGSFFYNPIMEFEDIALSRDSSGYPSYTYSDSSVLHQLLKVFDEKGFKFVTVREVK